MNYPSQQHSQQDLSKGFPQGSPLTREHLHDADPLDNELQQRLDAIGKQNYGEVPK